MRVLKIEELEQVVGADDRTPEEIYEDEARAAREQRELELLHAGWAAQGSNWEMPNQSGF